MKGHATGAVIALIGIIWEIHRHDIGGVILFTLWAAFHLTCLMEEA